MMSVIGPSPMFPEINSLSPCWTLSVEGITSPNAFSKSVSQLEAGGGSGGRIQIVEYLDLCDSKTTSGIHLVGDLCSLDSDQQNIVTFVLELDVRDDSAHTHRARDGRRGFADRVSPRQSRHRDQMVSVKSPR